MIRAFLSFVAALTLIGLCPLLAQMPDRDSSERVKAGTRDDCRIEGVVVRGIQGNRASDAEIVIIDVGTGQIEARGYTDSDGRFQFDHLSEGRYEAVARAGVDEAREQVWMAVPGFAANVVLNLPSSNDTQVSDGAQHTISASNLNIPGKARGRLRKAEDLLKRKDLAEARRELTAAIEIYPAYAQAFMLLGLIDLEEQKARDAAERIDRAVSLDPGLPLGYVALAACYNALGQFRDALHALEQAQRASPATWQVHFETAKADLGLGNVDGAIQEVTRTEQLTLKPPSEIHLVKAEALIHKKQFPDAVAELQTFLRLEPQSPNATRLRKIVEELQTAGSHR